MPLKVQIAKRLFHFAFLAKYALLHKKDCKMFVFLFKYLLVFFLLNKKKKKTCFNLAAMIVFVTINKLWTLSSLNSHKTFKNCLKKLLFIVVQFLAGMTSTRVSWKVRSLTIKELLSLPLLNSVAHFFTVDKAGALSPEVETTSVWISLVVNSFFCKYLIIPQCQILSIFTRSSKNQNTKFSGYYEISLVQNYSFSIRLPKKNIAVSIKKAWI